MRPTWTLAAAALTLGALSAPAQQGVRKFDLYGFMDISTEQMFFIGDGSMYEFIGLDEDMHVRLDHVNLYFDFRPNDWLRGLTEIRFLTQPLGSGIPGVITDITFDPAGVRSADTTAPQPAPDQRVSDESTGGFFEWNGISLERAWIDIAFGQYFNLMIGQFVTPVGIWNVDHGSPVITPVQTPYAFSFIPVFPTSQVGFAGHGSVFVEEINLDYWLYISTGRAGLTLETARDVAVGGNVRADAQVEKPWLEEIAVGVSGYTGMLRDETSWARVTFTIDGFNPNVDSQFGAGFSDPNYKQFYDETHIQARETALGVDLKARLFKGLTLQGEFLYQNLQNHLDNDALTHTFDWYALLQYKLWLGSRLSLTPYAMFERMWSVDAVNNPASWFWGREDWSGQVIDAFNITTLGLNLNLFTNFTVKAEGAYVNSHTVGAQGPYQDIWDACILSTQFVLAF